jgi:hypothetical protein
MPETISIPAQKHRHILVTLYLWLMLLVNAIAAFTQFGQINDLQMRGISFSLWIIPLIVVAHLEKMGILVLGRTDDFKRFRQATPSRPLGFRSRCGSRNVDIICRPSGRR